MFSRSIRVFSLWLLGLFCWVGSSRATLTNRWSFNNAAGNAPSGTTLTASVGTAQATVRGQGATFTGASLVLPGTTNGQQATATISAFVDLPNGLISSKTNLTLEFWATPLSAQNWMRIFDFGCTNLAGVDTQNTGEVSATTTIAPGASQASDGIMLSFDTGADINQQRMEAILNGASTRTVNSALPSATGTPYHYVVTFQDGVGAFGSSGGQLTWYRDGVVAATTAVPFRLSAIQDFDNWLGRSQWTADMMANAAYNEFRVYDNAMTPAQVIASRDAGPDALPAAVTPVAPAAPVPLNRWSFNAAAGAVASGTVFTDSSSALPAVLRGRGGTLNGMSLVLPGTTNGNQTAANVSAYLDLPNGIVSSRPNFSAEAWATPLSSQNFQRLFDFGRSTLTSGPGAAVGEIVDGAALPGGYAGYDNLVLSLNVGAVLGDHRLEGQINNGADIFDDADLSGGTAAGTEYHFVLTVQDSAGIYGDAGCLVKWYRNAVLQDVLNLPFHLTGMTDVNNWIGRSQWAADNTSNLALNELRLYSKTLSDAEVAVSYAAGPNAVFPAPVAQSDLATIHAGQKVLIPVLANDAGGFNPASVEIVQPPAAGKAVPDGAGRILYTHSGTGTNPVTFTYRVFGQGGYSNAATVTVVVSGALRIANNTLNVSATPPVTAVQVVSAFPNLTFTKPLCFASPPGDRKRLFVCEIGGTLKVIPDVTAANPTASAVLNLASVITAPARTPAESITAGPDGECGLLAVAFHPNYAQNGYLYVTYSVVKAGTTGWFQRLSRFTVPAAQIAAAAPVADPNSEQILLEQYDRDDNHNAGDLHFGADGYLYMTVGDEGNPNDHWVNSQRIDKNFCSGVLRLDVDRKAGNLEPNAHASIKTDNGVARYKVPADNPFVGATSFNGRAVTPPAVRTEFWAVGLRSPWRFSIDAPTGDVWVGDVGQDTYEEVDVVTKGGNYGWVYREGFHDTAFTNPAPPAKPAGYTSIDPVWDYVHTGIAGGDSNYKGNSVIGGIVYRGTRFPSLTGAYIFGDHVSGNIWSLTRNAGAAATVTRIAGSPYVANFGVDPSNGDVLMSSLFAGAIMRLVVETPTNSYPASLSATGLFADLSDLSPAPGLLPYSTNLTFWSDYAVKKRWFIIPDATSHMTWARDGAWTYPAGEIWVKHFDLETVRGNPASPKKRIETRVLVRNASGVYGVSYKWNDAGTEATLAPDGGADFPVNVTVNNAPYAQQWRIPSRSQCVSCHSPQAGHSLSFNTRQLNLSNSINGFGGNQLDLLRSGGYLSNSPGSTNLLPRYVRPEETAYPVEARVRSYLAVNCAYCHQAGGSGPSWDGRPQLTLAQTGLINGSAADALSDADKLVVPGDYLHSIVYNHTAADNGYTRMPPIASNELDPVGIALLKQWIMTALPAEQTYDQWRLAQFGSATSAAGDPAADPDGDGRTNYAEFLAGTSPLSGASAATPGQVAVSGGNMSCTFDVPANRSATVEASSDLVTWGTWDVPGNNGVPTLGGPMTLTGPMLGPQQFFRLRLQEN